MNTHTPCSCRAPGCQQSRPSARMASGPSPEPGEPCQAAIGSEACPSNWAGVLLFWGASGGAGEQRTDFSFLKKKKIHTGLSTGGERERSVYGVLGIPERTPHGSESWVVVGGATRVGPIFKTPFRSHSFFPEAPPSPAVPLAQPKQGPRTPRPEKGSEPIRVGVEA